jgi:hypothetical protein
MERGATRHRAHEVASRAAPERFVVGSDTSQAST